MTVAFRNYAGKTQETAPKLEDSLGQTPPRQHNLTRACLRRHGAARGVACGAASSIQVGCQANTAALPPQIFRILAMYVCTAARRSSLSTAVRIRLPWSGLDGAGFGLGFGFGLDVALCAPGTCGDTFTPAAIFAL